MEARPAGAKTAKTACLRPGSHGAEHYYVSDDAAGSAFVGSNCRPILALHQGRRPTTDATCSNVAAACDYEPKLPGGAPKTSLPKFRSSRKPKPYVMRKPLRNTASGVANHDVPMMM